MMLNISRGSNNVSCVVYIEMELLYLIRQADRINGLNETVHVRLLSTSYISLMYQI